MMSMTIADLVYKDFVENSEDGEKLNYEKLAEKYHISMEKVESDLKDLKDFVEKSSSKNLIELIDQIDFILRDETKKKSEKIQIALTLIDNFRSQFLRDQ
jgi:hypothetical protein